MDSNFFLAEQTYFDLLANASLWLLILPPIVTLFYQHGKHRFQQTGAIDLKLLGEDEASPFDFIVFLIVHFSALGTAVFLFIFDQLNRAMKNDGSVSALEVMSVLGAIIGIFCIFSYLKLTPNLIKAYQKHNHTDSLKIPKCWQAKARIILMWYYILISIYGSYVDYVAKIQN